jgi:hypothetical protein
MTKQNIFIINYNSLYEILEEIKENFSFEIIKYKNEKDFIEDNHPNIKNSLVILQSNQKLSTNESLSDKNYLNLKKFPLAINRLVELINIQLIKLRFNHQSKVIIKDYELDLNSKFFFKDNTALKLTEKEIEIILYLNEYKTKHNVLDLQKNIWGYSPEMETHTVETHIYRLRKKINEKFNDENFILSHKSGYFIE